MATPAPRMPLNLTALAETLRPPGPGLWTAGEATGCTLEIRGLDTPGEMQPGEAPGDTVYVVASGYGLLLCGQAVLECTAGDVLFVPGGQPHRFETPAGGIRIWRIAAVRRPAGGS